MCCPFENNQCTKPIAFIPVFKCDVKPKDYYVLQSVVCHTGGLNSGHYYTFAIKQTENERVWNMAKCNDSIISKVDSPMDILQQISGKTEQQSASENSGNLNAGPTFSGDYGVTGYMYCYAKVSEIRHFNYDTQFRNKQVLQLLDERNKVEEEKRFKRKVTVSTNYQQDVSQMTNFSVVDSRGLPLKETFEIDIRSQLCDVVEVVKQHFAIPPDFQYRKVVVYQCGYRSQYESIICDSKQALSQSLYDCIGCGDSSFATINLFFEFLINGLEQYDPAKTYIRMQRVTYEIADSVFHENTIQGNVALKFMGNQTLLAYN